jgi:hypothetical protein
MASSARCLRKGVTCEPRRWQSNPQVVEPQGSPGTIERATRQSEIRQLQEQEQDHQLWNSPGVATIFSSSESGAHLENPIPMFYELLNIADPFGDAMSFESDTQGSFSSRITMFDYTSNSHIEPLDNTDIEVRESLSIASASNNDAILDSSQASSEQKRR